MRLSAVVVLILAVWFRLSAQTPTPTPAPIREEVTVTATRVETRLGETPASVVIVSRDEIEASAAPTVDDILRQTVGFSIFRRSSSRNANPTTQGVSLRGVGASGASRSVVLFDGVPLGDPFGGWVQWNRVPAIAIETVEVLRGGAASLYGTAGLSGAVNIISRTVDSDPLVFSTDIFGGTQKTLSGSAFAGYGFRRWFADGFGSSFQTRGFRVIDEAIRGPIDIPAGVRTATFAVRLGRDIGERSSVFVRPSYFGEVRSNGTPLQTNRTHIRQFVIGGDFEIGSTRKITVRGFGGTQVFDQNFSAISAARTSEALTRLQRVPVQNVGLSTQVSAVIGSHSVAVGVDARNIRGSSDEVAYASGRATALIDAGGRETAVGVFVQDFTRIGRRVVLAGSLRYDRWRNYDAFSANRPLATNNRSINRFADRIEDAFSPQAAFLITIGEDVSLYANAARSFRAPTLNELYRAFRVGSILTLANENLSAERATNIEGGVNYARRRVSIRASAFHIALDDAVGNITLSSTPDLITRRRQNAGKNTSRGLELEAEWRVRRFTVSGGYLFADARVTDFPTNPQRVNLRVPQVPRHQYTLQTRISPGKWTLAAQARGSGSQFDDDLNIFLLERYFQADVTVGRDLRENLRLYAAVENVFNSRYSIGRTPIRSVNSPANFRVGIRWK